VNVQAVMPAPVVPDAPAAPSFGANAAAVSSGAQPPASGQASTASAFGTLLAEISDDTRASNGANGAGQNGVAPQTKTDGQPAGNATQSTATAPGNGLPASATSQPTAPLTTPRQLIWQTAAGQTQNAAPATALNNSAETPQPAADNAMPQTAVQQSLPQQIGDSAPVTSTKTAPQAGSTRTTSLGSGQAARSAHPNRLNATGTPEAESADNSQASATAQPGQANDAAPTAAGPVQSPAAAAAAAGTSPATAAAASILPANQQSSSVEDFEASEETPATDSEAPHAAGNTAEHPASTPIRARRATPVAAQSNSGSAPTAIPAAVTVPVVTVPILRPATTPGSIATNASRPQATSPGSVDQPERLSVAPQAAVEVRIRMNGQQGALNTSLLDTSSTNTPSTSALPVNAAATNAAFTNSASTNSASTNAAGMTAAPLNADPVNAGAVPAPSNLTPGGVHRANATANSNLPAPDGRSITRPAHDQTASAKSASTEGAADRNDKQGSRQGTDDSSGPNGDGVNTARAAAQYSGQHTAPAGSQAAATPAATAPSAATISHAAAPAPVVAAPATSPDQNPQPAPQTSAQNAPAAGSVAHVQELADAAKPQQQPIRSMSLEFTPDGAQDVRVRLTERGGDVHISLHSTDAALNGRLRDGVEDLAGTLNNAGYNADAWASGRENRQQNQQQQRDAEQQQRQQRRNPNDSDNQFGGMMQQTNQEAL
jgi:hypothetical protein